MFQVRQGADRLATVELADFLIGLDDRPWAEWKAGKPLSKSRIGSELSSKAHANSSWEPFSLRCDPRATCQKIGGMI
jgi:hypothetical protein